MSLDGPLGKKFPEKAIDYVEAHDATMCARRQTDRDRDAISACAQSFSESSNGGEHGLV
jgi:hypothetical protein